MRPCCGGQKPSTFWILPLILVYFTALQIPEAVNPKLVLDLVKTHYGLDGSQGIAAQWEIIFSWCATVPALLAVALYGGLSDRFGRKFVLIIHISISIIAQIAFAITAYHNIHVFALIVGYVLFGISGSAYTFVFAVFSYCADCTSIRQKSQHFGWVEAACYLGNFIGPFLGGWLYDTGGRWVPPFVSSIVLVISLLYIILILPESLPKPNRADFSLQKANPIASIAILFENKSFSLFTILFALTFNVMAIKVTMVFYAIQEFNWSAEEIGTFVSILWLNRSLVVIALIPFITYLTYGRYWTSMIIIRISLAASMIALGLFALSSSALMFYSIGLIFAVGSMYIVGVRTVLCSAVSPKRQGAILSAIATMELLISTLSLPFYDQIYSMTYRTFPAAFFVCAAVSAAFAFTLSWFIKEDAFRFKSLTFPDDASCEISLEQLEMENHPMIVDYENEETIQLTSEMD